MPEASAAPGRSLFVTVLDDPQALSSREEILRLVDFAAAHGIDTLFVQVYRENKAWFPAPGADDRPYARCAAAVGEDPFARLLREAHARGIRVHAWLNLLSVGANAEAPLLSELGASALTRKPGPKRSLDEYRVDGQFFLEPGDPRVRASLGRIVRALVRRYPELDGVQFDYIRYPDWTPFFGYTRANLERFARERRGEAVEENPAWKDWRRRQVTGVVRSLRSAARNLRPQIAVSTTGLAPYSRAYHEAFQDWRHWAQSGLADFVTLMAYTPSEAAFRRYVEDARSRTGGLSRVNVAVGAYALGADPEAFARQMRVCEEASARSCAVFHYGSLRDHPELEKTLSI